MDTIILGFIILTISSSVSSYYFGKRRGMKDGYQSGWIHGSNDQSAMEIHLRNKINDLEETIKRFEVGMLAVPKKRGRPKLK
jgi:hypothetical protein